jgi:hypothetical protein
MIRLKTRKNTYRMSVADPGDVLAGGPVLHGQRGLVDQLSGTLEREKFKAKVTHYCEKTNLGSMLCSLFSAIFTNTSAKNWRFSKKATNLRGIGVFVKKKNNLIICSALIGVILVNVA